MITIVFTTIGRTTDIFLDDAVSKFSKLPKSFNQFLIVDNSKDVVFKAKLEAVFKKYNVLYEYIFNTDTLKMGENWNTANSLIRNPWFLVHHDDDFFNIDAISKMDLSLFTNDIAFVTFDFFELREKKIIPRKRHSGMAGIIENTPKFISTFFNTKHFLEYGGWNDASGFFLDFHAMITLQSKHGSNYQSIPLGYYRIHQSNASVREKRNDTYGNYIGFMISDCLPLISEKNLKKEFLYHICSYSFPTDGLLKRIINKLLVILKIKAWII